jgi:hypothetical protein
LAKLKEVLNGLNALLPFDLANHLSKYKNGAEGYNISFVKVNLFSDSHSQLTKFNINSISCFRSFNLQPSHYFGIQSTVIIINIIILCFTSPSMVEYAEVAR